MKASVIPPSGGTFNILSDFKSFQVGISARIARIFLFAARNTGLKSKDRPACPARTAASSSSSGQ